MAQRIRAIVFDLDGTLYVCPEFAATIQEAAVTYMAGVRGEARDDVERLMADTRRRLAEESGTEQTISAVCRELGGSISALHACFEGCLRPESFLERDGRVIDLLERLCRRCTLYIYTNNNRALTTRIISYLGLENRFADIFSIDDAWRPKPDEERLEQILSATGLNPEDVLFVGDRFDIDLRLPEQKGCPIYLSRSVEQLLRLDELIG